MSAPEVTALLPVHAGVDAHHFRRAIESLAEQSRPPDELVVVQDGPLPVPLLDEVTRAREVLPVAVADLPRNQGAGVANQAGLELARGEWIAKADADDVSLPHRLARQHDAVHELGVDLCGAAMLEFVDDEADRRALRLAPLTHREIGRRLRSNNPVNHPTAFYRRRSALAAGGYPPWRYMQDYGLFARMYAAGSTMANLAEPLVLFRSGAAVNRRRRTREVRRLEVALQRELRELGLVSGPRMVGNVVWRSAYRVLPDPLMRLAYRRLLSTPLVDAEGPE